jgi:hypothetical protein
MTFMVNGTGVFLFQDGAGNTGSVDVTVTNIVTNTGNTNTGNTNTGNTNTGNIIIPPVTLNPPVVVGAGGGGGGGSSSSIGIPGTLLNSSENLSHNSTASQNNTIIPIGIQRIFNLGMLSDSLSAFHTNTSGASSLPQEVNTLITQPAKKL